MKLRVTDHAVLRYLQRVVGVDVDALRSDIKNRVEASLIKGKGLSDPSSVKNGKIRFVIKDGVVVTVTDERQ